MAAAGECPARPRGTARPGRGPDLICRVEAGAGLLAAVTQFRHRHSEGRAYFDKTLAEGKTRK